MAERPPPTGQLLNKMLTMLADLQGQCLALDSALFAITVTLPPQQQKKVEEVIRLFLEPSPEDSEERSQVYHSYIRSLERILNGPKKGKTS